MPGDRNQATTLDSNQHKKGQSWVSPLSCSSPTHQAEPMLMGCTPTGAMTLPVPLPQRKRNPEPCGVWRDPKTHSCDALPACCSAAPRFGTRGGHLHPSLASSRRWDMAGGTFQERKKKPSINRAWNRALRPSLCLSPPFPLAVSLSLPASPWLRLTLPPLLPPRLVQRCR